MKGIGWDLALWIIWKWWKWNRCHLIQIPKQSLVYQALIQDVTQTNNWGFTCKSNDRNIQNVELFFLI